MKIGIGEAVQSAVSRAAKAMKNIGWFETSQIRGSVADGKITEFQVQERIGFRLEG